MASCGQYGGASASPEAFLVDSHGIPGPEAVGGASVCGQRKRCRPLRRRGMPWWSRLTTRRLPRPVILRVRCFLHRKTKGCSLAAVHAASLTCDFSTPAMRRHAAVSAPELVSTLNPSWRSFLTRQGPTTVVAAIEDIFTRPFETFST